MSDWNLFLSDPKMAVNVGDYVECSKGLFRVRSVAIYSDGTIYEATCKLTRMTWWERFIFKFLKWWHK